MRCRAVAGLHNAGSAAFAAAPGLMVVIVLVLVLVALLQISMAAKITLALVLRQNEGVHFSGWGYG